MPDHITLSQRDVLAEILRSDERLQRYFGSANLRRNIVAVLDPVTDKQYRFIYALYFKRQFLGRGGNIGLYRLLEQLGLQPDPLERYRKE